jgi:hypothetical protein
MKSKKAFSDFVQEARQMSGSNHRDKENIKNIIRRAIDYYGMKTVEKVEETESGRSEVLYLASVAEENMLNRITDVAFGNDGDGGIEAVYEGYIVRKH